jgi:electron transfer flavoprotein alpha subunit
MSILVYTENWDGKFKKLSFELVSYASEIAAGLNCPVVVLSIGEVAQDELQKLAQYGASKIFTFSDPRLTHLMNRPYAGIIAQAAKSENAKVVLFANNNTGKAIAPIVSVKLKAGLVTAVTAAPSSINPFVVRKKVFTAKAYSDILVSSEIKVLTLSQNSFGLFEKPASGNIESFAAQIDESEFATTLKEVKKITGKILLTDAEIVVSGGRGMKGPEQWGPIEELAGLLNAATACSRPVSDEGWRPHTEHVGQTGKIIAPNLYIACGISGAIQHLGGVSSSKCIVAINKDPDAPIFQSADYGILGDVQKVLPDLITAVKELKSGA